MALESLDLINFRSYGKDHFSFSPRSNLIVGANGVGKTNLLEAIYVLANTKSWREPDRHLVSTGKTQFRLEGAADNKRIMINAKVDLPVSQKALFINRTKVKPQDYFGQLRAVLFEPQSLDIVYGGPADRRQWLNQVLAISDPTYMTNLLRYRRIIKQRNTLLRTHSLDSVKNQVFAWDINLAEIAGAMIKARLKFVSFLNQKSGKVYQELSGKLDPIKLTYRMEPEVLSSKKDYATALLELLDTNLERDWRFKHTTAGPHRDDITIAFKNERASQVASRGEARTLVLGIKLLEYRWLSDKPGSEPIMLFDDIFSELDQRRRQRALSHLKKTQVFITATDLEGLRVQLNKNHQVIKL